MIPAYTICIFIGAGIANLLMILISFRKKLKLRSLILSEIYGAIGALIGAKLYTSMVEAIVFQDITRLAFSNVKNAGLSFFGALCMGGGAMILGLRVHELSIKAYMDQLIFLVPLFHGMMKIGCYMAGCCSGWVIFPVQLLEAGCLFAISICLYVLQVRKRTNLFALYLILYGVVRFILEFFRIHIHIQVLFIELIMSFLVLSCGGIYFLMMQKKNRGK